VAFFAVEVGVEVIVFVVMVAMAEFISHAVASVFEGVYKVIFAEEGERAEYVGFVDCVQFRFQFDH